VSIVSRLPGVRAVLAQTAFRFTVNTLVASTAIPTIVRWRLLRALGFDVEPAKISSGIFFGGRALHIGAGSGLNIGCVLDNLAPITIGRNVSIGHQALLLTSAHERGTRGKAAGALVGRPILVEDGAWIGARAMIMPGVTVGAGATVAAGAVVTKDCLAGGTYAGVPARLIRAPGEPVAPVAP
jgi:maltose O-acetyltransferase